jgi:hypothetical protein
MKPFIVSVKQAVLGWPFYSTWNLVAYMREQHEPDWSFMVAATMVVLFTSGLWLAFWLLVGYLILPLVNASAGFIWAA